MSETSIDILAMSDHPGVSQWRAVTPAGSVAGVAGLRPAAPFGQDLRAGELSLYVEPRWRRRGIGSRLLAAVNERIAGQRLLADVAAGSPGEAFCRRHGFQHTGSRRQDRISYHDVHQAWLGELVAAEPDGYRLTHWTGEFPDRPRVEELLSGPGRPGTALLTAADAGGDLAAYALAVVGPLNQPHARQYGPVLLPRHHGRRLGLWVNAALIQRLHRLHPHIGEITSTAENDPGLLAIREYLGFRPSQPTRVYELAPTGRPIEFQRTQEGRHLMSSTVIDSRPELTRVMQEIVDSGITGFQLRVSDEHGEWTGSAGLAELDGNTPPVVDGYHRIGSNTKTFTAVALLALVAEGRVALDTAVADYLPEFGFDPRITVRMLLQHTSGIFNFTGEVYTDGSVESDITLNGAAVIPGITWQGKAWVEQRFRTYEPEELVRLALSKNPRFEPGADWSYANTNYVVLRLIIEKVTGSALSEELQRTVFGPLGLTHTIVPGASSDIPAPHAHAYYRYDNDGTEDTIDVTVHNPSWISTGGDMISTTADLQAFITGLVTGKLLPAEILTEMFDAYPAIGYGLGVFVQDAPDGGGKLITHNGGAMGHAALMYTTLDGSKTLTAALNYVDDANLSQAAAFQAGTAKLLAAYFGGGEAEALPPAA
ncbi:GNAT family N-acetyltransferase [Phytomonospora endophytica]|uniref:CubicO group peptidase (Beta-lactamase class C family) n=1 Tax=Phytomonospora endophytica TaxID=714109 RepID=A0A841FRC7_9ACTN|nr:GNAT family N-acetyltransferase [Phytomonospora endophytica]MBB6038606.1 CubicO group peptidase (beta-lactamase class C family) [Phytomonospora endophytica]GIG69250.1 hypothetical protein Pen01_55450 [Phytomonospora endophytica]